MTVSADGKVRIAVYSDGEKMKDDVGLVYIKIQKGVNKIPLAYLVILDHCVQEQDFPISKSDFFKPGKEIKIELGHCTPKETAFKGIVITQTIKTDENTSELSIDCRDRAIMMTIERNNENYLKKKDSEIISELFKKPNYSKLTAKVTASATTHDQLTQHDSTDWDFMLTRAEAAGMIVIVEDSKVTVQPPDIKKKEDIILTNGTDLIEFNGEVDAKSQMPSFTVTSWDPKSQQVIKHKVVPEGCDGQGELDSAKLAKLLSTPPSHQTCGAPQSPESLEQYAKANRMKAELARIRGSMTFLGNAKAKAGGIIKIIGAGDKFDKVFIGSLEQTIKAGAWVTTAELGMAEEKFAERTGVASPPAGGLLPSISGLQIGVVMKLDGDPTTLHRIQVKIPVQQAKTAGIWARLAMSYASKAFGSFVLPEVGDEVVLGYFDKDPSQPVILGSLYNGKHAPPYPIEAPNNIKAFVSREKLTLELDEKNKVITVKTPGKNTIIISDKEKGVLIQDQNKNKIELNESGITLESPKDIKITAKGAIEMKASKDITLKASGDLNGKGTKVALKGSMGFEADGGMSAKVTASGTTTVEGTLVKIN